MKKIVSLVLLTGMLTLMSFGRAQEEDCFDGATRAADYVLSNGGTQSQADSRFHDYFEVCSECQGFMVIQL